MNLRNAAVVAALAIGVIVGGTACGSSDSGSTSVSFDPGMTSVVAALAVDRTAAELNVATAQKILRTVVNPATSEKAAAAEVDSTDTTVGADLHRYAVNADRGGYTPDVWAAKSVESTGKGTATVTFAVASPHAPAPVDMQYDFVRNHGRWKLTADAVDSLLASAGPHH
jgi:predicted phage tail protein